MNHRLVLVRSPSFLLTVIAVVLMVVLVPSFALATEGDDEDLSWLTEDEDPFAVGDPEEVYVLRRGDYEMRDPWESWNRAVFSFNDTVDVYAMQPIAEGYDFIVPDGMQSSLSHFFTNLEYPVKFVSSVLRFDFSDTWLHTQRFFLNSTLGFGGFFDVATDLGVESRPSDIGLMLAHYDVGFGPYFVIPFIGPSSVRDTFGLAVERSVLSPFFFLHQADVMSGKELFLLDTSFTVVEVINTRSRLLEAIKAGKEASMDFYSFAQGAYFQRRVAATNSMKRVEEASEFEDEHWMIEHHEEEM